MPFRTWIWPCSLGVVILLQADVFIADKFVTERLVGDGLMAIRCTKNRNREGKMLLHVKGVDTISLVSSYTGG